MLPQQYFEELIDALSLKAVYVRWESLCTSVLILSIRCLQKTMKKIGIALLKVGSALFWSGLQLCLSSIGLFICFRVAQLEPNEADGYLAGRGRKAEANASWFDRRLRNRKISLRSLCGYVSFLLYLGGSTLIHDLLQSCVSVPQLHTSRTPFLRSPPPICL